MDQLHVRRPNNLVAGFAQPQTKVDVIESDCEIFVEPSELYVDFPPHHRASSGYCGKILRQMRTRKVAGIVAPEANVRVTGDSTCSKNHSAVLDRAVRIPEACANHCYFRSHHAAYHFTHPVTIDH